ncbi:phosphate ABC transporter permease subunit PstC [Dactylosporangium fulvum]|uniref:Phosphate transport system permease protein n=1 Tax=Dactylosporangium fulvum TaxID=53359 RepID=A0ABY5VN32_9ACTN|nr:phosphate ABC transporter permease subunit PstC [Dactylosporangium fulvum]UWP79147.1 phosphate ABC transporter permease subunit PstC [Dactylosporangium fulvum]
MTTATTMLPTEPAGPAEPGQADADAPRRIKARPAPADVVFRFAARSAGAAVLAVALLVGSFLAYRAGRALGVAKWGFFTTERWEPDEYSGGFGIAAVLSGTVVIAVIAIAFAVPLAVGAALYISEYSPRRIRRGLVSLVDLMAAVPSVVYGLFGVFLLQPNAIHLSRWLATYLGWIPFFRVSDYDVTNPLSSITVFTASSFMAGMVVAMMVTPIVCSISREVFAQAPVGEREGAYALGGTRWGMIRTVVLPYGRGGIIGGAMLGLGRALGETIAVYMIISPVFEIQWHVLQTGAISVSSLIALRYGDAGEFQISALMAAGLALFLMTLLVNFAASIIIGRSRSGAAS